MTLQEFINKYNGVKLDWDKNSGAQCVDLIKAWASNIGSPVIRGNAITWAGAQGYMWIKNTPTGVPQAGDIIVWNYSPYGHVAVCISANIFNIKSFDQNWPTGSPCKIVNHYLYRNVLGWLRPSGASKPVPATPTTPQQVVYIVKRGDTLSGIASRYGTTYQALAKKNGIANPNRISVGQKIII